MTRSPGSKQRLRLVPFNFHSELVNASEDNIYYGFKIKDVPGGGHDFFFEMRDDAKKFEKVNIDLKSMVANGGELPEEIRYRTPSKTMYRDGYMDDIMENSDEDNSTIATRLTRATRATRKTNMEAETVYSSEAETVYSQPSRPSPAKAPPDDDNFTVDLSGWSNKQMEKLMSSIKSKMTLEKNEKVGRDMFNMMTDGGKGSGVKPYPKKMCRNVSGGASVTGGASCATRGSRERESKRKSPKADDSDGSGTTFFTAAVDDASVAKTVVSVPFSVKSKPKYQYVPPLDDNDGPDDESL